MAQSIPFELASPLFRWEQEHFTGFGMDNYSSDTAPSELFRTLNNIMPITSGSLDRRWGYSLFATADIGVGVPIRFTEYLNDTTGVRKLIQASATGVRALNEDGTEFRTSIFTPGGGATAPRLMGSRSYAYFADSVGADLKKWDGSAALGVTKWGITAPVTAISVGAPAAGAITLLAGRDYFLVFKNSTTGHCSGLSPVSATTGPLTAQQVPLSNIQVSGDAQVDVKVILATADGGDQTTLYKVAEIANAVTVYTDTTPEETLLLNNIYSEIDNFGGGHGVLFNDPPPSTGTFPTKHRGRAFLINGQFINFSKNLSETTTSTGSIVGRYEECWPATYQIDISTRAETPKALLSDGNVLYVGTERHIRQIAGDGPDFGVADIAFNEVGVVNAEVWKVVFSEGQPVGTMWLSPDKRVLQSNLTDYVDVGTSIQTTLNSLNSAAIQTSNAMFVSDGEFDLYILAIPTGSNTTPDTLCVYNLRTRKWVTWTLADNVASMCFSLLSTTGAPQWLFASSTNNKTYRLLRSLIQDRAGDTPVDITATFQTNWNAFGDPTARKALNELEFVTADSALSILIEGASTVAQFDTPNTVKNSTVTLSPFGEYKIYPAASRARDRYFRLTGTSTGTASPVLEAFSVLLVPVNRT
jgi:hypothetical protein